MKSLTRFSVIAIVFCLLSISVLSQTSKSTVAKKPLRPTTTEEYNYLTKGYKVQIESGLDMKAGYSFAESWHVTHGNYDFFFQQLMKGAEHCALSCTIHSSVSNKTHYVCIPYANDELMELFNKTVLTDSTTELLAAFTRAFVEYSYSFGYSVGMAVY